MTIVPSVPLFNNKYPGSAYLEGFYNLPDGSLPLLDADESPVAYLGLLTIAIDRWKSRIRSADSETKRNETLIKIQDNPACSETKRNETKKCKCGCGRKIKQSPTGRKKMYYEDACRLRHYRSKKR